MKLNHEQIKQEQFLWSVLILIFMAGFALGFVTAVFGIVAIT